MVTTFYIPKWGALSVFTMTDWILWCPAHYTCLFWSFTSTGGSAIPGSQQFCDPSTRSLVQPDSPAEGVPPEQPDPDIPATGLPPPASAQWTLPDQQQHRQSASWHLWGWSPKLLFRICDCFQYLTDSCTGSFYKKNPPKQPKNPTNLCSAFVVVLSVVCAYASCNRYRMMYFIPDTLSPDWILEDCCSPFIYREWTAWPYWTWAPTSWR